MSQPHSLKRAFKQGSCAGYWLFADQRFTITRWRSGWRIQAEHSYPEKGCQWGDREEVEQDRELLRAHGLEAASFPTRREAVERLRDALRLGC